MRPEALPHTRLQHRYLAFRVQTATVDDADAPVPTVTAPLNEMPDVHARLRHRHAVQVASIADDVLSAPQLSDLAPVNAWRCEIFVWFDDGISCGRQRTGGRDWGSAAVPPARIRLETDDVRHFARERISIGAVVLPFAFVHWR